MKIAYSDNHDRLIENIFQKAIIKEDNIRS